MLNVRTEKRALPRADVSIEVELECAGGVVRGGRARNLSAEGVLVEIGHRRGPQAGTELLLTFRIRAGGEHLSRRVRARVVRRDGDTLALAFTERDLVASAVVADLCHYEGRGAAQRACGAAAVAP